MFMMKYCNVCGALCRLLVLVCSSLSSCRRQDQDQPTQHSSQPDNFCCCSCHTYRLCSANKEDEQTSELYHFFTNIQTHLLYMYSIFYLLTRYIKQDFLEFKLTLALACLLLWFLRAQNNSMFLSYVGFKILEIRK